MLMLAALMIMTIAANAMSYKVARDEALFLSDKMAHELNMTTEQYEAVFEINLDYFLCLTERDELFGVWWERRKADLFLVLSDWQYERWLATEYLYRPARWEHNDWVFLVYDHYKSELFFFVQPKAFKTYKGGNNRKSADFYASRIADKPANAAHHHAPVSLVNYDADGTRRVAPAAAPAHASGVGRSSGGLSTPGGVGRPGSMSGGSSGSMSGGMRGGMRGGRR